MGKYTIENHENEKGKLRTKLKMNMKDNIKLK